MELCSGHNLCFVCEHIFTGEKPVLLVVHEDHDWQFLCGESEHSSENGKVIGLSHLLERDPSLKEILALPDGCLAERPATDSPWIKSAIE